MNIAHTMNASHHGNRTLGQQNPRATETPKMNTNTPPHTETGNTSELDPKLLELLVCPKTKGPLDYDSEASELVSRKAGLAYPIRKGLPIMLISEARKLRS